jgi:uncharacterized protein (DUF58 family)
MAIKRQAIFWGALFLSIVALVLHVRQLFAMAAVLACLPLISAALGRRKLAGLSVTRHVPHALNAGERSTIALTVANDTPLRKIFFAVSEALPAGLQQRGGEEMPVAILGGGEETTLSYEIEPRLRGQYPLGDITLTTTDPLGLRAYRRQIHTADGLLVYPQAVRLPNLWPAAGGGQRSLKPRRRLRGLGDEFYGVRDYVPGDDPRHIDWKISARRNRLVLVEFERSEALDGMIILDLSSQWQRGLEERHTLEYAVTIAASAARQAWERGSTVGLMAVGSQDFTFPAGDAGSDHLRLIEALARVQVFGEAPLVDLVAARQELLPRRGTVLVLSPSPAEIEVAHLLRGLGQSVGWFVLQADTFGSGPVVDYTELVGHLQALRARVQIVRGDRPLASNWQGGSNYAQA